MASVYTAIACSKCACLNSSLASPLSSLALTSLASGTASGASCASCAAAAATSAAASAATFSCSFAGSADISAAYLAPLLLHRRFCCTAASLYLAPRSARSLRSRHATPHQPQRSTSQTDEEDQLAATNPLGTSCAATLLPAARTGTPASGGLAAATRGLAGSAREATERGDPGCGASGCGAAHADGDDAHDPVISRARAAGGGTWAVGRGARTVARSVHSGGAKGR
mmetsp:Transcript_15826/g.28970  ORF Transcript_15826/g.28970 Transcript_15826/m.28970 type:complete len:227 (-) Transcript_15826:148-828(-)